MGNEMSEPMGCGKIAAALAKAQAGFPSIPKTKTAKVRMKSGGEYAYQYADLASILSSVVPVLSANELALMQDPKPSDDGVLMETVLMHSSGEMLRNECRIKGGTSTPQEMGSLITYARRYGVCSLLGIAAEDDSDAQDVGPTKIEAVKARIPPFPQVPRAQPSQEWHPVDGPPPPTDDDAPPDVDSLPPAPAGTVRMFNPDGSYVDSPVMPFGRSKGKPMAEASLSDLKWMRDAAASSIEDPSKAKFKTNNQRLLGQVEAEISRRGGPAK
jgi:hypothetical protein